MKGWAAERWAAAAGVGFVVLMLIGGFAPGTSYPNVNDSPESLATFVQDHHRALALAAILTGLAAPLLVWLVAGLVSVMRNAGHGPLAVVAFGTAVAGTAVAATSDAVWQVLARVSSADSIKAGFLTQGFLVTKAFWFAAVAAAAVGVAGWRGAFARWYAWATFAAALLFALGGLTVKLTGVFRSNGPLTFTAFLALLVWVLLSSVVLWSVPEREPAASAAAPPAR
jgi:hypothetical protein